MQIFGYFSSNKIKFYGLNGHMGHLCLHKRPIGSFNPKAVRLDEKYPPLHMHRKVRTYIRREPALNYVNKFREGACRSTTAQTPFFTSGQRRGV